MKWLAALLAFVASIVLAYAAIAFIVWDPHPGNWDGGARFAVIFFGGIFGLFAGVIAQAEAECR